MKTCFNFKFYDHYNFLYTFVQQPFYFPKSNIPEILLVHFLYQTPLIALTKCFLLILCRNNNWASKIYKIITGIHDNIDNYCINTVLTIKRYFHIEAQNLSDYRSKVCRPNAFLLATSACDIKHAMTDESHSIAHASTESNEENCCKARDTARAYKLSGFLYGSFATSVII